MTFSPAAFSALALASTASVADSLMAAIRALMRPTGPSSRGPDRPTAGFPGRMPPPTPVPAPAPRSLARMHGVARSARRRGAGRRGGGLLALIVLVGGLFAVMGAPARAATDGTPPPEAFILVDAKTGAVIMGRHM